MKSNKPLWRISVGTTPEAEEAVAELLGAVLERAASSHFNLKTGASTATVFSETRPANGVRDEISAGLARIRNCGLAIGAGKIVVARVRREDWAESWKRHFRPIEIGKALLIKPSWIRRRVRPGQAVVVLDPGLSFGTGQHPTTAFCLQELVRCGKFESPRSFLDIGTGSGILAIAAVKLGYSPVRAFDFDPEAVRVARANAAANGVSGRLPIALGDVTKMPFRAVKHYDLICANLISTLLLAESRRIVAQLKPGGRLVLAGILKTEFLTVQKSFEKLGLKLAVSQARNEWRSGAFGFAKKI